MSTDDADRTLADAGRALADGVERALPVWVERSVERLLVAYHGEASDEAMADAVAAAKRAAADVVPRVRDLVARDVDDQHGNPLAIVREAVTYPSEVLARHGVPPVVRDEFAEEHFPDDVYDLTPMTFGELDESLHEPGLVWGAAKAQAHMRRHRR